MMRILFLFLGLPRQAIEYIFLSHISNQLFLQLIRHILVLLCVDDAVKVRYNEVHHTIMQTLAKYKNAAFQTNNYNFSR